MGMLVPLLVHVAAAAPPASRPAAPFTDPIERTVPWAAAAALPPEIPAAAVPWGEIPFVVAPHPVAFHYGRRYQEVLVDTMGGPRGSPVFGPLVAQADVHWRLVDATGVGLALDADTATRWRDAAIAGSLIAAESVLDETVERAPVLYGVYIAADTLLSPSFDLRETGPEKRDVELVHRSGGPARRAIERAEDELGEPGRSRKPTPSLGVGLDWDLRDEEAPETSPLIQYTAWLTTTEIGITSFRAEVAPATLAWVVTGREMLRPKLFAIGTARSADLNPTPSRLSGGLMWMLPWDGWSLKAERIVSLEKEDDTRWMLTLRCENRTRVPAPPSPALGDRGRPGPTLPWVPDTRPNRTTRW